jgi:hypothetical protein
MLTFLFWNLAGRPLAPLVAKLCERHAVDVLVLAECAVPAADLVAAVNATSTQPRQARFREADPASNCPRLLLLSRIPRRFVKIQSEAERFTIRRLCPPGRPEVLLIAVHLSSKLFQSGESQTVKVPGLSQTIRDAERRLGHTRTLLVGDLNMNPFEPGVVAAEGLNAVMTREIASRGSRTVEGQEHPFFYNPMWSFFGDATHQTTPPKHPDHRPSGTFYRARSESVTYYWNLFDQVLLRPALLPHFRPAGLRILSWDGTMYLVNDRGHPDATLASDHLPLLLQLDL